MKRIGKIIRPARMTLDEMSSTFHVLSEDSQREYLGGCFECARNLPGGTVIYTESGWLSMMEAGTWEGGWVCGRGYVAAEAVYVGLDGAYCNIHWSVFVKRNDDCDYCLLDKYTENGYVYYGSYGGLGGGSGGSSSGGLGGGSSSGSTSQPSYTYHDIMKDEYFFGYEITKDCLVGSKKILEKYGITNPGTSSNVYQLMVEQNGNLVHYGNAGAVSANYSKALACIDRHLQDSRPIIIGINHSLDLNRNEGATDHFMVITGKGYDADKRQYYYTYADPGRKSAATGCDMENNRLYYNPDTCEFYDPVAGSKNTRFDVTQVRPNDGKYLDETIVQPPRP